MKYNQELPKEVETQLDIYIERIKAIKWFSPASSIDKTTVEKHATFALDAFGVKASIEYKTLKTEKDWDKADEAWGAARCAALDAAWDAARGAAWDAAWGATWDAAWGATWDAARGAALSAALDAARGAAWDAAWGAQDILALNLDEYKKKYPNGNFINLIPLYELGLWPLGVIDGKFIIAVPPSKKEFPIIE